MTREGFENLVSDVLDNLPENFAKQLDNIEIIVEAWPSEADLQSVHAGGKSTLFGLYRGVAKTNRTNYSGVLPDIIVIFAGPILSQFQYDLDAVKSQVRKTVLHEIGHHFGMSDEEIYEAQDSLHPTGE